MKHELTYRRFGDQAILIEWPKTVSSSLLDEIIQFNELITLELGNQLTDAVLGYNSITLFFAPDCAFLVLVEKLKKLRDQEILLNSKESVIWNIPVCYDDEFALDLQELSAELGLTKQEIIKRHSNGDYLLHFIGFLPGFMYLGGLDLRLHYPRKKMPRTSIRKGAVGIAGEQTGIYPKSSPAGWNIIGNSPIELFDSTQAIPCFASPGDHVRFHSIDLDTHKEISLLIENNQFDIQSIKTVG